MGGLVVERDGGLMVWGGLVVEGRVSRVGRVSGGGEG